MELTSASMKLSRSVRRSVERADVETNACAAGDCDFRRHVRSDSRGTSGCGGSCGAAIPARRDLFCAIVEAAAQEPAGAGVVHAPLRDGGAGERGTFAIFPLAGGSAARRDAACFLLD